jgi:predicted GH43/DUF377 family glycosyl hydrolase
VVDLFLRRFTMKRNRLVLALAIVLALSLIIATPVMAQGVFQKYGPPVLLNGPETFDSQFAGSSWVISDGGIYKMWYTGEDPDGFIHICYATSADGINWSKQGPILFTSGPQAWEASGQATPCVIKEGTAYYMWYTGINGTMTQIGMAASSDGINWVKQGVVLSGTTWDSLGVAFPCVINDGGTYRMWYTGRFNDSSTTGELRIGTATFDGFTWVKGSAAVFSKSATSTDFDGKWVGAGCVVKEGLGIYTLYYTGFTDSINGIQARIGKASSGDGATWTRDAANPILNIGTSGSWDDKGVGAPCVILMTGITKMWYTGGRSDLQFKIGYAYLLPSETTVPASSNWSTGIIIGGVAVAMGVVLWGNRRYQYRKK